jgi:hypothetical protein
MRIESFAGTGTVVAIETPLRLRLYVCGVADVLTTRIDVTTTVVDPGTV